MIPRHLAARLLEALADTPVVFLAGARQTGKSTLARSVAGGPHRARYLSFDDPAALDAARRDPAGFVAGLDGPVVLDEVQRAPGLFPAIKAAVDADRQPGRFLLTGSAAVMAVPAVAEHLVGRMELLTLWPFTQGEREGARESFVDGAFGAGFAGSTPVAEPRAGVVQRLLAGGYPEALTRTDPVRRAAWFDSYLDTMVQREVRDLAAIEGLTTLPRLLRLAAARTGGLLSWADLARDADLPQTTLKRYLALLEALYLLHRIPAWSANLGSRQVKAPKLFLADSGLAAHLAGSDAETLLAGEGPLGPLLETFAVNEILRAAAWSATRPALYHFRTHAGREVDLVLEDRRGRCVAVEIKATATPGARDAAGLTAFAETAGKRFLRGVLLYLGKEVVPFAANIHAVPIGALWAAAKGKRAR